jgi:hypothetical protein
MAEVGNLTVDDFAPHIESAFRLQVPDGSPITVTLREATPVGPVDSARRAAFALLFAGPKIPALPQQIYALEHAVMGEMEIFLVPIGETGEERQYEANFN